MSGSGPDWPAQAPKAGPPAGWGGTAAPRPTSSRRWLGIALVVAVLALGYVTFSGRGGGSGAAGDGVPWSDYAASVRTGIDAAAAGKDCPTLQGLFDNADANNASTMTRTGHNNAALMGYIDERMKAAGCYR